MNVTKVSDLMEALSAWGEHEATGRRRADASFDLRNPALCADFALRFRAPLVASLLQRLPTQTLRVEFDPEESDAMRLCDGRTLDAWANTAQADDQADWQHVQAMVSGTHPLAGPIIVSAQYQPPPHPIGPIVLWDGWHRAAAWRQRFRQGIRTPLSAFLVVTAQP